jgi:hypothetical protein
MSKRWKGKVITKLNTTSPPHCEVVRGVHLDIEPASLALHPLYPSLHIAEEAGRSDFYFAFKPYCLNGKR